MTRFSASRRFKVSVPTKGTNREMAARSGLGTKKAQPGFSGQALACYVEQRPSIPKNNILRTSTQTDQ
jgi:hypothetical protein